ncbi:MAG: hypothetical protein KDA28_06590 [Phycisphaerales bacterium]|nr:hypothetical protein [Phycisphaerales bacterium]
MDLFHELALYATEARFVRLHRDRPSQERTNGCILAASPELVLVHEFNDFAPDGYRLLRLRDIEAVDREHHEILWESILRDEGLLVGVDIEPLPRLDSMRNAIADLHATYGRMIIVCEDDDEDVEDFFIGHVVEIGADVITFLHFDADGAWETEPHEILIEEITKVQFRVPYLEIFWRHLRDEPPIPPLGG